MSININNWKSFCLYDDDLFDISSGTKLDKSKMKHINPTINFVGRSGFNQGITDVVDEIEGLKPFKPGDLTLSLGGEKVGSCFVQKAPFYTSQNVAVLQPKHYIPQLAKEFICAVIFKESQMHYKAFIDELNRHIKTDFTIKLPATIDGHPDWDYMKHFMESIETIAIKELDYYSNVSAKRHIIDISRWKEFKVGDLFDIHPTKSYKLTNTKLMNDDGTTPVVVNSSFNNGIGGYTKLAATEQGNIITFSDTTTADAVFYQEGPFVGYPHIQGMYPKKYCEEWDKYTLNFFIAVFKLMARTLNYDYVNKFTRDYAKEINIKLPIDNNNDPDWDYMRSYIKQMECFSMQRLNNLSN